jgi:hypothetical protein
MRMEARHPRASYFLPHVLFDHVSSFSDLEARVERLQTAQGRGDAFETVTGDQCAIQDKLDN